MQFNLALVAAQPIYVQFLQPVATFLVGLVGAWLAIRLQRLQATVSRSQIDVANASKEIAASQRDIALDRLKFDLFEKRYAIYEATQRVIFDIVQMDRGREDAIRRNLQRTSEAIFFFSDAAVVTFEDIRKRAERYLEVTAALSGPVEKDWSELEKEQRNLVSTFVQIFHDMPNLFRFDFGFSQLTGKK